MKMPPEIIFVDDESLFKMGFITLLNHSDYEVKMTANDGLEAIEIMRTVSFDIALVDLEMPNMNGSELLNYIQKHFPHIAVVILSSYHNEQLIMDLFNRGAKAFLSKNDRIETVIEALDIVSKGNVYQGNIRSLLKTKSFFTSHCYKLMFTNREREIIHHACLCKSVKKIAKDLSISEKAVEAHLTGVYKKLGVKNRLEFITFALEEGLQFIRVNTP